MEQGFSFVWIANSVPMFISPTGKQIPLVVRNNVPYMAVGDDEPAVPAVILPHVWGTAAATCTYVGRSCYRACNVTAVWDSDEDDGGRSERREPDGLRPRASVMASKDHLTSKSALPGEQLPEPEGPPIVLGPVGLPVDGEEPPGPETEEPDDHPVIVDVEAEVGRGEGEDGLAPLPPPAQAPPLGDDAPRADDGDEPVADVDGGGLRRTRRAEAQSAIHKLTHLPKNPFCQACQEAKMKQYYSKRGAFAREVTRWGAIITCDHMAAASMRMKGIGQETTAMTVKDVFTGMIACYPVPSHHTEHVIGVLRHFVGRKHVDNVYSDNAPELIAGVRNLGWRHETSRPGVPRNNSMIERANQIILGGTTACLIQAGLSRATGLVQRPHFVPTTTHTE